ncbi:hypothetical protein P8452_32962 [Trifolium repens]|nr:hypothetical protein P8452_32962 [Trifolium repens]
MWIQLFQRFNRNDLVIEALLAMENVILISPLAVNQEAENISVECYSCMFEDSCVLGKSPLAKVTELPTVGFRVSFCEKFNSKLGISPLALWIQTLEFDALVRLRSSHSKKNLARLKSSLLSADYF